MGDPMILVGKTNVGGGLFVGDLQSPAAFPPNTQYADVVWRTSGGEVPLENIGSIGVGEDLQTEPGLKGVVWEVWLRFTRSTAPYDAKSPSLVFNLP